MGSLAPGAPADLVLFDHDLTPSQLRNLEAKLPYYAERFRTTEINYTFHRIPATKTIENWSKLTPEEFRFALKVLSTSGSIVESSKIFEK